jgi:hypothetical protein
MKNVVLKMKREENIMREGVWKPGFPLETWDSMKCRSSRQSGLPVAISYNRLLTYLL